MLKSKKFKPFIGRTFTFKNYTALKDFPSVILVLDETMDQVKFLDKNQNPVWVLKFYLKPVPFPSTVFAVADKISEAMVVLEMLRSAIQPNSEKLNAKTIQEINKTVPALIGSLRKIADKAKGLKLDPELSPQETETV